MWAHITINGYETRYSSHNQKWLLDPGLVLITIFGYAFRKLPDGPDRAALPVLPGLRIVTIVTKKAIRNDFTRYPIHRNRSLFQLSRL